MNSSRKSGGEPVPNQRAASEPEQSLRHFLGKVRRNHDRWHSGPPRPTGSSPPSSPPSPTPTPCPPLPLPQASRTWCTNRHPRLVTRHTLRRASHLTVAPRVHESVHEPLVLLVLSEQPPLAALEPIVAQAVGHGLVLGPHHVNFSYLQRAITTTAATSRQLIPSPRRSYSTTHSQNRPITRTSWPGPERPRRERSWDTYAVAPGTKRTPARPPIRTVRTNQHRRQASPCRARTAASTAGRRTEVRSALDRSGRTARQPGRKNRYRDGRAVVRSPEHEHGGAEEQ